MNLTINRRLQIYFVCFAVFLLLAMAMVVNYRFQSDFIDFLNEEKHQALDALAEEVSRDYASDERRWQQFINHPQFYKQIVSSAFSRFSSFDVLQPPNQPSSTARPPLPPHMQTPHHGKAIAPPHARHNDMSPPPRPPHLENGDNVPPPTKPTHQPPSPPNSKVAFPIALVTLEGETIHGQYIGLAENHFFSPVKNTSGETIAKFTLPKNTEFSSVQQQAYLNSFKRTLWIILALGVLLSFVLAHLLAKVFTQPIAQLNTAVKALRNRDFNTKLPATSKDEFGQLSSAFNDMTQKLAEYEAQQRKWLGNISHDLRTPVAVLKGEVDAVVDGIRQPTPETFESLSQEIDSLSMMLDQFHQTAMNDIKSNDTRLSTATQKDTQIDPKPLLQQLAKRSEHSVKDAGLNMTTEWHTNDIVIGINELTLTQIWQNLLQNSIRYTVTSHEQVSRGMIDVCTHVVGNIFVLTWQDSAPSVPTEALSKLAEPLYRVEQSRNRDFAGSGLGLSIVKDIVSNAGGDLQFSHSELGGLKVTVLLPLA